MINILIVFSGIIRADRGKIRERGDGMGIRIRLFLLALLLAAAAFSAFSAFQSIRGPWDNALPDEIYRSLTREAGDAAYMLRVKDGRVAVYPNRRGAAPERITSIELCTLRPEDRAMICRGIPAADRQSLLLLLEDIGS